MQTVLQDLDRRMARLERRQRLGVFVDVPNVIYGAERGERMINMGRLLDMLSEGRDLVRATAYSPVSDDPGEPIERQKFVAPFVPHEYRIVTKPLKRFADGSIKGNFDVEMAVDMVTMAERLDVIALVSGDADFARVVEVLQGRGVRVEVIAFENSTSAELRAIADHYIELSSVVDRLR
ncbi:MAG: NYN domain-containing protein [Dehalococcoidia bacterium]